MCILIQPTYGINKVYWPRHFLTPVFSVLYHFLSISNKKLFINQNTLGSNNAAANKLCKHQMCILIQPTYGINKVYWPRHFLTPVFSVLYHFLSISNKKLFINQNTLGLNNAAANKLCKHQICMLVQPTYGINKVYWPRHF